MTRSDPEFEAREVIFTALRPLTTSQRHHVLQWAVVEFLPTKKMLDSVGQGEAEGWNP